MEHCCSKKAAELERMKQKQGKVLWSVLLINLIMFFLEMYSGIISHSTALLSDGLDMLGDAFVYAFSLYVIDKNISWKVSASLFKAFIMCAFGLAVFGKIIYQIMNPAVPVHETMGLVGLIALSANLVCFFMLYKFKEQDCNMKSTWMCSRNDIVANVGVLFAAYAVSVTHTIWPDIIIGLIITILFLNSAFHVLKISFQELQEYKQNQLI